MATFGLSESTEVVNLRRISIDKLLYISATLSNPRYQPAVEDVLLEIDSIAEAIQCLDSFMQIPEDIYNEISSARRIIERVSNVLFTPIIFCIITSL